VQYLRRELAFKKPYDQVVHENDIKRLKSELKDAQQALRENVAVISQELDGPNQGLQLVDKTVKYTNQIQVERRELLRENEMLKSKIAAMEAQTKNGEREREKFFEGASWAAKQGVIAGERAIDSSKKAGDDYRQRVKECDNDSFMRLRCAEWLLDQTQRIVKEVRDANQQVLENAVRSQATATQIIITEQREKLY